MAGDSVRFRRVLVAAQLAVSVSLIVATSLVTRQLTFLQTIPVGFDKEQVAVIPIADRELRAAIPTIKDQVLTLDGVVSVAASSHAPGQRPSGGSYAPQGYPEGETEMMDRMSIDDTYLATLGMEIVAGRGFSRGFPADEAESILINEAAAREFGWQDPIGKTIGFAGTDQAKMVVGVVKDFHFSSPHRLISPIYIDKQPTRYRSILVKMKPTEVSATIERLREKWSKLDPHRPFDYYLLNTAYDRQFRTEQNLSKVFGSFTLMAILVTCLGLLGISFLAARQTPETAGIRRFTGRELVVLSVFANLVAWPVAYFVMNHWLQEFPYRTSIGSWPFATAALLMLVLGLATAASRSGRALDGRLS
jgi:putative ABC transport system permease protein